MLWVCECESVSVCEASQCDWTCNVHGRNGFNQLKFKFNIKNPHHVPECVMPSEVMPCLWSEPQSRCTAHTANNHSIMIKLCSSKSNEIFQTPELSQNCCWLKCHDSDCDYHWTWAIIDPCTAHKTVTATCWQCGFVTPLSHCAAPQFFQFKMA